MLCVVSTGQFISIENIWSNRELNWSNLQKNIESKWSKNKKALHNFSRVLPYSSQGWSQNRFRYIDGCCSVDRINCSLVTPVNRQRQSEGFFFRGTFHNIFKLDTRCSYDCIGTSGKKFPKPLWEGFVHKTTADGIWLGTF